MAALQLKGDSSRFIPDPDQSKRPVAMSAGCHCLSLRRDRKTATPNARSEFRFQRDHQHTADKAPIALAKWSFCISALMAIFMMTRNFPPHWSFVQPDLNATINALIEEQLLRYSKDFLGYRDFANGLGGGKVLHSLTSASYHDSADKYHALHPPEMAITPGVQPGRCWSIASGRKGFLAVSLSASVVIDNVTIDHLAVQLASDISTAPKDMMLWGLLEDRQSTATWAALKEPGIADSKFRPDMSSQIDVLLSDITLPNISPENRPRFVPIATFSYDILHPSYIQSFPVDPILRQHNIPICIVILEVQSNWGNEKRTCLYRLVPSSSARRCIDDYIFARFRLHGTDERKEEALLT